MSKLWIAVSSCLLLLTSPMMALAGTEEAYLKRDNTPWSG